MKTTLRRLRDGSAITEPLLAAGLTQREAEITQRIAHGQSTRQIAGELEISQRTAAKHLERSFSKLDVHDQSAVAAKAWAMATLPARPRARAARTPRRSN